MTKAAFQRDQDSNCSSAVNVEDITPGFGSHQLIMFRQLLQRPACRSYRHGVMRSSPSISGVMAPRCGFSMSLIYSHLRSFSSAPRLQLPDSVDEKDRKLETGASSSAKNVPWYLQEDVSPAESQPVSSRDNLPELPEDSPAILPVMLEYTFKDLGLDDLKLFDLRSLETPPALGANVIMIIGTARSVKHLNVAADRLCRWLRSNYKLSPYADGLLGRNELKIKLRRKNRRARLASQSGRMTDDKDDGITTGWICVNAGVVEEPSAAAQEEAKSQGFEGFGAISTGTRVVVQIFTEEKRAEVDLEGLWQATLDRAARQRQRDAQSTATASPEEVRGPRSTSRHFSDYGFRNTLRSKVNPPLVQTRELHSSRSSRAPIQPDTGKPQDIRVQDPAYYPDIHSYEDFTTSMIEYISSLPSHKAQLELGTGPDDRESTLFLRRFYYNPPRLSARSAALAQIRLMCVAIGKQHEAYTKERLWKTFMDFSICGYDLPEELGLQVVSALLARRPTSSQNVESPNRLLDADKELALRALENLSLRGTNVVNMKMLTMLYAAFSPEGMETVLPDSKDGQALSRLSQLIHLLDIPFDPEQARILMPLLFRNHDYDGFWKLWRKLPLDGSSRTPTDYEQLFGLHAELGDERRARDCLSTWVPMMAREEPPIELEGILLRHVMYCVVIADPDIEHTASTGPQSDLTWLWTQCCERMLAEGGL